MNGSLGNLRQQGAPPPAACCCALGGVKSYEVRRHSANEYPATPPTEDSAMPALFLSEDDVRRLVDVRTAVDAVEEAFRQLAAGGAVNVPRFRAVAPGVVLHSMNAAAPYLGLVGWKSYTTTRQGAVFHVGLSDAVSGRLVALLEADWLGQLRTGAATAVAVEWMAALDAAEIGLFGAGKQARTQLAAVAAVRPL